MNEVTIKYKDSKTLKILKDLAKYFDFVVLTPKEGKKETETINGVTIIPGDRSVDMSELTKIFSGRNLDAKELRKRGWERKR